LLRLQGRQGDQGAMLRFLKYFRKNGEKIAFFNSKSLLFQKIYHNIDL
jgi:hypothetical protein